jgi:hypothetical protein
VGRAADLLPFLGLLLALAAADLEDFVPQVAEIISVGEFYEQAAGGQVIFT